MLIVLYLHRCISSTASRHFFGRTVSVSIASKVRGNPISIICQLCITGKLWIIRFIDNRDLSPDISLFLHYYAKLNL